MPIRWRDTLGWKTPFNASWTISTGQGWMQKSNGSAVFALPASRRHLVVLPQALSFRCPSLMCPSSRSGWIWWDRCQSLPGVMSTSWSFWTTPPGTRKPSPFVQQMQKTLPESCFCWPAKLGYQRKSWLTRVHTSCGAHARLNESLPETTRSSQVTLNIRSNWTARAGRESGSYLCASNFTPTAVRFLVSVFLCLLCFCRMSYTQMICSQNFQKNRSKKRQKKRPAADRAL